MLGQLTCVMYFPDGLRTFIDEFNINLRKSQASPCGVVQIGISVKSPNT